MEGDQYFGYYEPRQELFSLREDKNDKVVMTEESARKRWEEQCLNDNIILVKITPIARRRKVTPEYVIEDLAQ